MSKLCSWKVDTSSCNAHTHTDVGPKLATKTSLIPLLMSDKVMEVRHLCDKWDLAEVDSSPGVSTGIQLGRKRHQTQNTWNHGQQGALAAGHGWQRRLQ